MIMTMHHDGVGRRKIDFHGIREIVTENKIVSSRIVARVINGCWFQLNDFCCCEQEREMRGEPTHMHIS